MSSPVRLPDRVSSPVRRGWARVLAGGRGSPAAAPVPPAGYPPGEPAGAVDLLDDADLAIVNDLLPWSCFTVDSRGRRLGDRAWAGKREEPQAIPDPRVVLLDERFGLADKHVLEIGCFEGVHTIALCRRAAQVTAVDGRVVNVVKTVVRCALYGHRPTVLPGDVETWTPDSELPDSGVAADVVFHVGVLYHLKDPVGHLVRLGQLCRVGMLLDTHVATEDQATETMTVDGIEYRYRRAEERPGPDSVFAGLYPHARWLLLEDLVALLRRCGFDGVEVVDERTERNGRRVTIVAGRSGSELVPHTGG